MTIRRALFGLASVAVAAALAFGLAGAVQAQIAHSSHRPNHGDRQVIASPQVSTPQDGSAAGTPGAPPAD